MKICTIYTNCQGYALQRELQAQAEFGVEYDIKHYMITDVLNSPDRSTIYQEMIERLKQSDLLIYQKILPDSLTIKRHLLLKVLDEKTKHHFNTDFLLQFLPSRCKTISMPSIYFEGYHIENKVDARNLWREGIKFAFGNKTIDKLIAEKLSTKRFLNYSDIASIVSKLNDPNLYSAEEISDKLQATISTLREKEAKCDIKISDWIEENFQQFYLFHTPNHPSKYTIQHVVSKIMYLTGYHYKKTNIDWMDYDQLPISPCVIKHYDLKYFTNHLTEPEYRIRVGVFEDNMVDTRRVHSFNHDEYWTLYISLIYRNQLQCSKIRI